jgi:tetratricopeptide (TPR) repeat protein
VLVIGLVASLCAAPVRAQSGKTREFTRQGLLITNFTPADSSDFKLGRRAADAVRSRVAKYVDKREVEVFSGGDIRFQLTKSGMSADTVLPLYVIHSLGRYMRGDEYLDGTVARSGKGYRLTANLMLMRDSRIRQPLPPAEAPELDLAAEQLAKAVGAARAQLVPQRRCENALRDGHGVQALQAAREGVAAYARSALARTCLLWAMRSTGAEATEILSVARELLAIDERNAHGIETAAMMLDTLRRRDEAATMWLRLAATDTADLELTQRVLYAMIFGGNSRRAEPLALRASDDHPENVTLLRLRWRITYDNKNWPRAITAGERLMAADSAAATDSVFFLRLASAYRANGQVYKAVELAARGVDRFPGDVRLYTLYAGFVKTESDTVVPRGLALFPRNADLYAMSAKDLRAKGQVAEALQATRTALAIDSTLTRGELLIAQGEVELGRPDSALAALHRAVGHGEDTSLVAQFALARGNALLRAANGTKSRDDFRLAMRFLGFADTLRKSPQSTFLFGVAAYSITQSALTDAPKMPTKPESCELSRMGAETLPLARAGLEGGQEVSPDAAKQYLDYLGQLEPYVQRQIDAFCGS